MSDSAFSIDQVTKLREIERARIKTGEPGLRSELQVFIARLQSGGVGAKSKDPRVVQAKRLWDRGFGLANDSFDAYLATIPEIPEFTADLEVVFPELVLVDARLPANRICELLGVVMHNESQPYADLCPSILSESVYWIRAQNGVRYEGVSVKDVRDRMLGDEIGLSIHEGLALLAQSPEGCLNRDIALLGSVPTPKQDLSSAHRKNVEFIACLYRVRDQQEFAWMHLLKGKSSLCVASRGK